MENLVKRAKDGDVTSTEEIINKFKYLIFKEAGRYYISGFTVEDLVQHGYLSVIKAIKMYKLESNSFNGYCINSIKMNFMALLKGEIKHNREVPDYDLLDVNTRPEYEFTLEDEVIAYEEMKKLYETLKKLEPMEREIVERFYLKEEDLSEIACDSSKSYHQISRMKKKALEKLRELM